MAKNDKRIKDLLSQVESQQKDLGKKPRSTWNTNAVFKFLGGEYFNLNATANTERMVAALAFLLGQDDCKKEATKRLGMEAPIYTWGGYTIKEWEEDFKTRIASIAYDAKKKKLDATKSKLKSLVSEEARTDMALDDIEKMLG